MVGLFPKSLPRSVQDGANVGINPLPLLLLLNRLLRWGSMTPLCQFKGVPQEVVHKAEGKQFVSHTTLICDTLLTLFRSPGTYVLI